MPVPTADDGGSSSKLKAGRPCHIICDGVGITGGFGVSDHKSVTLRREDIPTDAPVIRFRGLALMGGVGVTRKAYGAK